MGTVAKAFLIVFAALGAAALAAVVGAAVAAEKQKNHVNPYPLGRFSQLDVVIGESVRVG